MGRKGLVTAFEKLARLDGGKTHPRSSRIASAAARGDLLSVIACAIAQ